MIIKEINKKTHRFSFQADGKLMINDQCYINSVWFSQSQVQSWGPNDVNAITPADFDTIFAQKPEILIIGSGTTFVPLPSEIQHHLAQQSIGFEQMSNKAAIRSHLILVDDCRHVITALIQSHKS